jgi:hypothetical protein
MKTPILFLIFNRPDTAKRVFEVIRAAKPMKLYVGADGPRVGFQSDIALCEDSRRIIEGIDWECEVTTLYRDRNLGCKNALGSAISWFFDHEPEGIVLEDDCLPHISFFRFCAELLEYFRRDERVMMISGSNHLTKWKDDRQSYLFSTGGAWGWASWRRAWKHYDIDMKRWTNPASRLVLKSMLVDRKILKNNQLLFQRTFDRQVDSWDYQWRFARLINLGLTVTPSKNLVSNIGFRPDGTHTRRWRSAVANLPRYEMEFPLNHNSNVSLDQEFVTREFDFIHPSLGRKLWNRARRMYEMLRGSEDVHMQMVDDHAHVNN